MITNCRHPLQFSRICPNRRTRSCMYNHIMARNFARPINIIFERVVESDLNHIQIDRLVSWLYIENQFGIFYNIIFGWPALCTERVTLSMVIGQTTKSTTRFIVWKKQVILSSPLEILCSLLVIANNMSASIETSD